MTYEIPQKLEYKERIIFGLTFGQLIYALLFTPIVLACLLKLPYTWQVNVAIALIPSSIASIFIFTDLPTLIRKYLKWQFNRSFNKEKLKQYLNLKEINNSTLTLNNKKLSILKVEPINFTIKNEKEKDIIISTFQKFFNSLDFPIQIIIATDTINLDQYINTLEEKSQYDFQDFKDHLQTLTSQLLNRSFYLIIRICLANF